MNLIKYLSFLPGYINFQELEYACIYKDSEEVWQGKLIKSLKLYVEIAVCSTANENDFFFVLAVQITEKQILPIYLKVVESSYFNSSDKVNKLRYIILIIPNFETNMCDTHSILGKEMPRCLPPFFLSLESSPTTSSGQ